MEKLIKPLKTWIGRIGPAWLCIAAICLIAALSGYSLEISPAKGLKFAPAADAAEAQ
jgi:hypothetical protein